MSKFGLKNQVYLYSLETKDFYTDKEFELNEHYFKALRLRKKIKAKFNQIEEYITYFELQLNSEQILSKEDEFTYYKYLRMRETYQSRLHKVNNISTVWKNRLNEELKSHDKTKARTLRNDALKINKKIGLFESTLTRVCGFGADDVTTDLFVIRVFHYEILESIISNGFYYNGQKFIYFTSSAGQIRGKKMVVINEALYRKHENTITCGLTLDKINAKGGVNANKYQAYLALVNSASMKWNRFNIDRVVVVDDICTNVYSEVDHINRDTFEITRTEMDIPIEHMDGCGIMLPTVSKKSFMFRMAWMKGLLTPFDFRKFVEVNNGSTKIKDIYGKEYDIIEDNINIILTKSQFKMWKYYKSWDEYKENFKKYKCEASKLNIEDIGSKATINYQMLQTLTSMTIEELTTIAQDTINDITSLGKDKKTMLRVLGAVKENKNMNYFQQALLRYPELLSDSHSREVIKSKKKSLVKDAKAGKLNVNGYYTFIIPDLYAFCEWLFLGETDPQGLLNHDECHCTLFSESELDLLRAPHLYREHAIRKNIHNERLSEWFITKGVYTSVKDPISKILMFDNDGDKALVVQDETLVSVAKRDMEGVVPLYYEMTKAKDKIITSEVLYEALTNAYKANIGIISNEITKIWNSDVPNIDAVKWLCMINNFTID